MKNPCMKRSFIVLVFLILFPITGAALASDGWQEMPPLVLEECIDVDKILAPNPMSPAMNDFWMVLKYEERDEDSGEIRVLNPDQSLNMYLVTGLAVIASEGVGLPYYQFLVVSIANGEKSSNDGGPSSAMVQQWLLSDTNHDGKLNNVKFEQTTSGPDGETIYLVNMEVPEDQIERFQDFYERATRELNKKAENEDPSQCQVS